MDKVQTKIDRVQTKIDRVQTKIDKVQTKDTLFTIQKDKKQKKKVLSLYFLLKKG